MKGGEPGNTHIRSLQRNRFQSPAARTSHLNLRAHSFRTQKNVTKTFRKGTLFSLFCAGFALAPRFAQKTLRFKRLLFRLVLSKPFGLLCSPSDSFSARSEQTIRFIL